MLCTYSPWRGNPHVNRMVSHVIAPSLIHPQDARTSDTGNTEKRCTSTSPACSCQISEGVMSPTVLWWPGTNEGQVWVVGMEDSLVERGLLATRQPRLGSRVPLACCRPRLGARSSCWSKVRVLKKGERKPVSRAVHNGVHLRLGLVAEDHTVLLDLNDARLGRLPTHMPLPQVQWKLVSGSAGRARQVGERMSVRLIKA